MITPSLIETDEKSFSTLKERRMTRFGLAQGRSRERIRPREAQRIHRGVGRMPQVLMTNPAYNHP